MARVSKWLLLGLAVVGAGCNRDDLPTTTVRPRPSASRTIEPKSEVREGEEIYAAISRDVPAYGGHFLDSNGILTAYATSADAFVATAAAISQRLASGAIKLPPGARRGPVRVIKGEYTFAQLSAWRDSIFLHVLGARNGVVMDDLSEGKNRVTIGVLRGQEASIKARVLPQLAVLGIPEQAVIFESTSPRRASTRSTVRRSDLAGAKPPTTFALLARAAMSRHPTPTMVAPPYSLTTAADTLIGGLRIQYYHVPDAAYKDCTIGFTAQWANGTKGFITASHCSSHMWATDSASYYQPNSGATIRGFEAYDRSPGTCPLLWPCDMYRFSDANLNAAFGNWRRGVVGRPSGSPVSGSAGTTVLNGSSPYLFVVAEAGDVIEGQRVDKIGSYTGWTYGAVTHTCGDWLDYLGLATEMVRCVYKASVYTNGGDSGSPVFTWDGADGIVAYGILFAEDDAGQTMYFSKLPYVKGDVADGVRTSSVNLLTDITMSGSPTLSGSFSSGVQLSWTTVSVSGSSATTVYKVYRSVWDASTYTMINDAVFLGSTTGTSLTDGSPPITLHTYLGTSGPPAMCTYSYAVYTVVAYNSGVYTPSPSVYFRGNADGPTPGLPVCP